MAAVDSEDLLRRFERDGDSLSRWELLALEDVARTRLFIEGRAPSAISSEWFSVYRRVLAEEVRTATRDGESAELLEANTRARIVTVAGVAAPESESHTVWLRSWFDRRYGSGFDQLASACDGDPKTTPEIHQGHRAKGAIGVLVRLYDATGLDLLPGGVDRWRSLAGRLP